MKNPANDALLISDTHRPEIAQLVRLCWIVLLWLAMQCLAGVAYADWVRLSHGSVLEVASYEIRGNRARLTLPNGGMMILPTASIERILPDETGRSAYQRPVSAAATSILSNPLTFPVFDASQTLPTVPFRLEISRGSRSHAVNPLLVAAVIEAETDFYDQAFSTHEGRGLMMVRPEVAEAMGVSTDDLLNAERNIEAGTRYLQRLAELYPDDPIRVLAHYKAGGKALGPWRGGLPADPKIRNFILRVCRSLEQLVYA